MGKIDLKTLRTSLGLTQEEMAKSLEMPTSTYQGKERGESELSYPEAFLLHIKYGIDLNDVNDQTSG